MSEQIRIEHRWVDEELVNKDTVILIDEYIEVRHSIYGGIDSMNNVIYFFTKWAKKEQQASSMQSLTRRCLSLNILMLPDIKLYLESLCDQLPSSRDVRIDYGISKSNPKINLAFDPTSTHLLATIQTLKEQFETFCLVVELIHNIATKNDTLWTEIASTNGTTKKRTYHDVDVEDLERDYMSIPSVEEVKKKWNETRENLESSMQEIQSFLTHVKDMSEDNHVQETHGSQSSTGEHQACMSSLLLQLKTIV